MVKQLAMQIDTARLLIRTLQALDAEPLARIWSDPEVTRYMGGPRDQDQIRALLEEDAADPNPPQLDLWPVIEKASGIVVGHCGLLEKEVNGKAEVEVIYVLEPLAWGKGYAAEAASAVVERAFEELGLRRVIALIDPQNAASERVALKLGMQLEGETVRPSGKVMRVYAVGAKDEPFPI
jgi:ribosomal-protein-alanine N-acetyltransferase